MAKKSKHKGRGPAPKPATPARSGGPQATPAVASDAVAPGTEHVTPVDGAAAPTGEVSTTTAQDMGGDPGDATRVAMPEIDAADAAAPASADSNAPRDDATVAFAAVPAPAFDTSPVDVVDSGVGNPDDIRGVLIQLAKARLLLPNATIAEVLSYAEPDAIADAPAWLLGRIRWRGWQLPLIAFSQLAGISDERGGLGSKVVVLKALGGGKTPYFAVLTQGFPRLVTVSRGALVVDEAAADLPEILMARVTLNQDDAYLPDLARVEQLIGEALSQAA